MKARAKGLAALGVVGAIVTAFFAGGVTASNQVRAEQELKPEHVKIKIIETEIVKRESVPTMPEVCSRAVVLAQEVAEAFGKYDAEYSELKYLQQGLASSIASQNLTQLNTAKQALLDYSSDSSGIVRKLGEARKQLDQANTDCIAAMNP